MPHRTLASAQDGPPPPMPHTVDVVIVGTSVTGLTLAIDLKRRGMDYVMISSSGHEKQRKASGRGEGEEAEECYGTMVLQNRTLEAFEDLGLIDEVLKAGQVLNGDRYYVDGEVAVDWEYDTTTLKTHYPHPIKLDQKHLIAIMHRHIDPHRIRAVEMVRLVDNTDDGTTIVWQDRQQEGKEGKLKARYLVGCDGATSLVRRLAGIPCHEKVESSKFIMADAKLHWSIPPHLNMCFLLLSKGYAVCAHLMLDDHWRLTVVHRHRDKLHIDPEWFKLPSHLPHHADVTRGSATSSTAPTLPSDQGSEGKTDVTTATFPELKRYERIGREADERDEGVAGIKEEELVYAKPTHKESVDVVDLDEALPGKQELERILQTVVADTRVVELFWVHAAPIVSRCASTFQKSSVILCGEAATVNHPFFYQGMNSGVQDSLNLGWKLARVIKGGAYPVVIDTYDEERRPLNASMKRLATIPGHQIAEGNLWVNWSLQHIAPWGLNKKGWFNQMFTRQVSQIGQRYPTNTRLTGKKNIRCGLQPGERCPDAILAHFDGRDTFTFTRLHKILAGPHHTLICTLRLPTSPLSTDKGSHGTPSGTPASSLKAGESTKDTEEGAKRPRPLALGLANTYLGRFLPRSWCEAAAYREEHEEGGEMHEVHKKAPVDVPIEEANAAMLADTVKFGAHVQRLVGAPSSTPWGGVRVMFVFTTGRPSIRPPLPPVKHHEPDTTQTVASAAGGKGLQLPIGQQPAGAAYRLQAQECLNFLNDAFATTTRSSDKENALWIGWDPEGQVATRFKYGLDPKPSGGFLSGWGSHLQPWHEEHEDEDEEEESVVEEESLEDMIQRVIGKHYGAFTVVRPDGFVSHNGYLSDVGAREECLEYMRRYMNRNVVESQ